MTVIKVKESKECIILDDSMDGRSAEQCAHREQLEEGPWKETSEIPEDQSLSPKIVSEYDQEIPQS